MMSVMTRTTCALGILAVLATAPAVSASSVTRDEAVRLCTAALSEALSVEASALDVNVRRQRTISSNIKLNLTVEGGDLEKTNAYCQVHTRRAEVVKLTFGETTFIG